MKRLRLLIIEKIKIGLSYLIPLSLLRLIVQKIDSLIVERILLQKFIRIFLKRKNPFEEIEKNNKYIDFNNNYNQFSVFNMCYMSDMLGKAMFAIAMGCYPKFSVLDKDGENYYNEYFKKIDYSKMDVQTVLPKIEANTGNPHWKMSSEEVHVYALIYNKFFKLRDEYYCEFGREMEKIKNIGHSRGGKVYGCVVRGTDYLLKKPVGHPIQPQLDELLYTIKNKISDNDFIYLASDEEKTNEIFMREFPGRILTSDSVYYDGIYNKKNNNIAEFKFERENDKFLRGYEYFERIYVLGICDAYIGGVSGAVRIAQIINDNHYSPADILWSGVY